MKDIVLSIVVGAAVTALTQFVSAQGVSAPVISGFTPSDTQTIEAGKSVTFFMDMDQDTFTPQGFKGLVGDRSNPVEGALNLTSAIGRFDSEPLFETTFYWIEVCNIGGCSQSSQLTAIVEPAAASGPPAALVGASELGEDWWSSDWFGEFNIAFAPWIFHAQHGWLFIFEDSTPENIFLFDLSAEGWLFTDANLYPNLFSFNRSSWIFYFTGTSGSREFVDLQSGEFFSL